MGKRGPKPSFVDVLCPNRDCNDYGKIENENVVGNGTYPTKNGRVHKYVCKTCSKNFTSRANTILHDLRTDEETVFLALKMILKGMNLRSTADVLEVKLDTVRRWLKISADHSEEVNKVLMRDMDVDKVELDELWTFVKKKRFRALGCQSEEERWVWLSFATEHRLILSACLGDMTQKAANEVVKQTCDRINEDNLPLFVTDGRKYYRQALLDRYSYIKKFPKTRKRGRPKKPKQMPLKKLKYAQVVKERNGKDLISVTKRIIFGDSENINDSEISTSHIERENLNLRQENKRLARKTIAYSKKDEWLQHSLNLQMTAHNFQRPHWSLKKPNLKKIKEKIWKKHDKITPMMSTGITKHIWTLKELLTYPYHKNISI